MTCARRLVGGLLVFEVHWKASHVHAALQAGEPCSGAGCSHSRPTGQLMDNDRRKLGLGRLFLNGVESCAESCLHPRDH